ncbi:transmembrane protein 218-like [Haliotis asinina]|uniref:transmembrane protein 218-like n=1 Tax=Haliotis asinina TaxID=109174 RepID=UPI00353207DE
MARILGVGEGLFALAFIWTLCILLCLVFSRAQTAISNMGPVMIFIAGFLTIILVFIPREPQTPSVEEEVKIYDYSIIYRSGLIAVCALFVLVGLAMYLTSHAMQPIYAKPIRRLRG